MTAATPEDLEADVIVTRPIMGLLYCQCCIRGKMSDEDILSEVNIQNPCGTTLGWAKVYKEDDPEIGLHPIQCAVDPKELIT